ncbi:hypothetical protein QYF36_015947 [Acer negundo]|nr:hypothetical protein QYF36_015947 [Acer negundo]
MASAADPDITFDFVVPSHVTAPVDGNFFTFTAIRAFVGAQPTPNFKVTKASMAEFPALNGQSVSLAVLQFPAGTTNPPHTHPRSAELLFIVQGSLQVGFVDTTNKLFSQTLQAGTVSLPVTLFTTGIDDTILAKSFKTDVATVEALNAGLAPKP